MLDVSKSSNWDSANNRGSFWLLMRSCACALKQRKADDAPHKNPAQFRQVWSHLFDVSLEQVRTGNDDPLYQERVNAWAYLQAV